MSASIPAASGGSVEVPGGPALRIPAGALAADTAITIQESSAAAPPGALTRAYELGPSGTTFAEPVTVTFPVPAGTAAAAVWMRSGSAASFESVPTSVANGIATAQIRHFSIIVVGPVDFSGTWAGPGSYTFVNPNASTGGNTLWQARDVRQSVGEVVYDVTNSTGSAGTCRGTLSGSILDMSCTQTNLAGCTATYEVSGTATYGSPSTWDSTYAFTWTGGCPSAGQRVDVSVNVTQRDAPPMSIAGTYRHEGSWTNTGPGVTPQSGQNLGTRVRTQAPGSSRVSSTLTIDGGNTWTCRGPIVENTVYGSCLASNGSTSTGASTVNVGSSPLTVTVVSQGPLYGGPYTMTSGTATETKQDGTPRAGFSCTQPADGFCEEISGAPGASYVTAFQGWCTSSAGGQYAATGCATAGMFAGRCHYPDGSTMLPLGAATGVLGDRFYSAGAWSLADARAHCAAAPAGAWQ